MLSKKTKSTVSSFINILLIFKKFLFIKQIDFILNCKSSLYKKFVCTTDKSKKISIVYFHPTPTI